MAVTSAARVPILPDMPTLAESGFSRLESTGWLAFFMSSRVPSEIAEKVHRDATAAISDKAVTERLTEMGAIVTASSPVELSAFLKSEMHKWSVVIRDAGINPL